MAARKKSTAGAPGSRKKATRKSGPPKRNATKKAAPAVKKTTKRARAVGAAMEIVGAAIQTGAGIVERLVNGDSKRPAADPGNENGRSGSRRRKSTGARKTTRKARSR